MNTIVKTPIYFTYDSQFKTWNAMTVDNQCIFYGTIWELEVWELENHHLYQGEAGNPIDVEQILATMLKEAPDPLAQIYKELSNDEVDNELDRNCKESTLRTND